LTLEEVESDLAWLAKEKGWTEERAREMRF
jgi:hypothetical protein